MADSLGGASIPSLQQAQVSAGLAVPDADPATLKRPEDAAREVADTIAAALDRERHAA